MATRKQQELEAQQNGEQEAATLPAAETAAAPATALRTHKEQLAAIQEEMKIQLENVQRMHQAQIEQMKQQLVNQQQELRLRQQQQADVAKMFLAMEKQADWVELESLPVLSIPGEAVLPKQAQLYHLLRQREVTGATTPVTFGALEQYSTLGKDAPLFVRAAMGSHWNKWFSTEPLGGDYIPTQVLRLTLASMERLRDHWAQQENTAVQAATSYAVLESEGKKRRAQVLDADMADL